MSIGQIIDDYEEAHVGEQPCHSFKPQHYHITPFVHQCPVCHGRRAFCENCHTDHHLGGWENCKEENQEVNDNS